jgi:hypothetical protein
MCLDDLPFERCTFRVVEPAIGGVAGDDRRADDRQDTTPSTTLGYRIDHTVPYSAARRDTARIASR